MELQEKEVLAYQREVGWQIPSVPKKGGENEVDEEYEKLERIRSEEQERINSAEPLNEAELAEKEELLKQGFESWARRDFNAFIKASEKFGRTKLEEIAVEVEGKTLEEVKEYSAVFWQRYQEIAGLSSTFTVRLPEDYFENRGRGSQARKVE